MQSPFFRFSGGFRPVRGVSRAVTGCSEGVPGVFRVVLRVLLGCSGSVPGCSGPAPVPLTVRTVTLFFVI